MVDIDDPDEVIRGAGKFDGAIKAGAGGVGTFTDDDQILHSRADSPLDRALIAKLEWTHTTFDNAVREAESQAETTVDATVFGVNTLRNADIDGAAAVRRVET